MVKVLFTVYVIQYENHLNDCIQIREVSVSRRDIEFDDDIINTQ
jgi:hypothetical protein